MNARTLITTTLFDLGVIAEGQPLPAGIAQDCLRRLNNMVSGWRLQFGTVLAIERTLFNLTADQATYSIGSGGEFDVPRPITIDGAGLLLNGLDEAETVTITRVSTTATVAQTAHGLEVGDQVYISGAGETAYNGLQTVLTVPTVDTWTYQVVGSPTTPATGTIEAQAVQANPIELTVPVITDDMWQAQQLKAQTSTQPTWVYYNQTQPLGTITLWPVPTTGANQLVLYLQSSFDGFADLTTEYTYPDVPGYAEALQYNLGIRLFTPYSVKDPSIIATVREMAYETLNNVKTANFKPADLQLDPAYTPTPHGTYVIQTDQGA